MVRTGNVLVFAVLARSPQTPLVLTLDGTLNWSPQPLLLRVRIGEQSRLYGQVRRKH